ncbi:MAG: dihydropteroate synthase [Bacteroidales bacterium]|nr:dihydropteroate synthase [Bacteroidales bacterium]MBR4487629.1 dihydropteroate synthase [Bacteroidales bacterium]
MLAHNSIKVKSRLLSPSPALVMGILNVTDDSFYDGGRYTNDDAVLRRAEQILSEGADIIDVGAVSTKPGAADISVEEEWQRLEKPLALIAKYFPDAVVSVDTWRADIAQRSVEAGAAIINDVSGGTFDERMAEVVGRLQVPYVLMHTTAKPDKMQQQPLGEDMLLTMMQFFARQLAIFKEAGCVDLILDPGFGFGKTLEQNYFLMKNLSAFQIFECPILVGISRKSMIYKLLETSPDEALTGTVVLNTLALQQGASILRVHDVREAVEAVKVFNMYQMSNCK